MLCPVLSLEGCTVWLVCSEKAHHALCNVLMGVCIGRALSWVSLWWGITQVVICLVRMATVVLVRWGGGMMRRGFCFWLLLDELVRKAPLLMYLEQHLSTAVPCSSLTAADLGLTRLR
jgi:hypothetical protein